MRIAIATRIFAPEPSAASFRLTALAEAFSERGLDVEVLTVTPPEHLHPELTTKYRVNRFPVLRDKTGYVRGYLQYLSFDIPLFFRVLFGKNRNALVVEPPPTTWLFATIAAGIRRIPLYTYAADIWSDASESTGAPSFVGRAVRAMERFAWKRSRTVFAVNEGVAQRVREIAPSARVLNIGNGIDTKVFSLNGPAVKRDDQSPYLIYTGTASEWQGAEVFIHALKLLRDQGRDLKLVFLGQGTALQSLKILAESLQQPVEFVETVPPEIAAQWLRGSSVGLASIRPGTGYDFAFPTKVFASWATGTPTVYAGPGPVRDTLTDSPFLGIGVEHESTQVAGAIEAVLTRGKRDGTRIAEWAVNNVSLASVAGRVSAVVEEQGR